MEPVSQRIASFNADRLRDILPLKYKAMAESLFRFYRGTNHLFYEDLQNGSSLPASPPGWICGDLHLENFGSYKSDNRLVYFDLNDFDEAVLAPVLWELARMVTSIFVAFDSLHIEQKEALKLARAFVKTYASTLASGKPNYIEARTARGIVCDFLTAVGKRKQKDILAKKTVLKKNKLEILSAEPRHFELKKEAKAVLIEHVTNWLKNDVDGPNNYKVTDAVFRLAGTGSLGLKRYVLLLKSRDETTEKYLLLDMKQSRPSCLLPFLPVQQPAWQSEAQRIVAIQQRMQNRPPALHSTTYFQDDSYIIREMQPTKDSINFNLIKNEYRDMHEVIDYMAMLTASSQLRSSGRQGSSIADELIAFGRDEQWQQAVLDYAGSYSQRVKAYYLDFLKDTKDPLFQQPGNTTGNGPENNSLARRSEQIIAG